MARRLVNMAKEETGMVGELFFRAGCILAYMNDPTKTAEEKAAVSDAASVVPAIMERVGYRMRDLSTEKGGIWEATDVIGAANEGLVSLASAWKVVSPGVFKRYEEEKAAEAAKAAKATIDALMAKVQANPALLAALRATLAAPTPEKEGSASPA